MWREGESLSTYDWGYDGGEAGGGQVGILQLSGPQHPATHSTEAHLVGFLNEKNKFIRQNSQANPVKKLKKMKKRRLNNLLKVQRTKKRNWRIFENDE